MISVIYTQQVQKGRCEKTQSSFFTSPVGISESARRVPQGPVDLGFGTTEGRFSVPRNRTQTAKQLGFKKCSHFSDNKKDFPFGSPFCYLRERETGIEPATPSLARRCSTTEPLAHIIYCVPCEHK